tara:strand:+ start:1153 stop:1545 length:393 start_codon:yes stop_codon:yes gene_type:complete
MKQKIEEKILKEFGILIGIFFPIFIGWFLPFIYGHGFRKWTLIVGFIFLFIGLLKPTLLMNPYKLWIKLGDFLGFINSHVILGIVFFVVLFPISLFMRLFGYDPLNKRLDNKKTFKIDNSKHKTDLRRIF